MSNEEKPPRISEATATTDEIAELIAVPAIVREKYADPDSGPNLYAQLAHNPGLLRVYKPFSYFWGTRGLLSDRDREIAILRIAWLNQLPFVWGEHVRLGHGQGGLSVEEVERITEGSAANGWSEHDRAILAAVEELSETSDITDATWTVLARTWSEGQLVEFPMLIGEYQMLGYLLNVVRNPLWPGNAGLSAR